MSRIFLSHSSSDAAAAIAMRDWLIASGWDDLFLDLDPNRGLKAGERWQGALKAAAERCELVILLISPAWIASKWCLAEFLLAKSLNKRLFGVIIESTPFSELPTELTSEWQLVDLTAGKRDYEAAVALPPNHVNVSVAFSTSGLDRLRVGLHEAGLDASYFSWPPSQDPQRSPYRGLRPLEAEDAGIFFGRQAPILNVLDRLRGLRDNPSSRMLVILGASGAGKSSFLRAGLLPRLRREDRAFFVLPIVRPERASIYGDSGLLRALEAAFRTTDLAIPRAELRGAIRSGPDAVVEVLRKLGDAVLRKQAVISERTKPPTFVLPIDQAEELFLGEGENEAKPLLDILCAIIRAPGLDVIAVFTIRSDNYEHLQVAPQLEGLRQETVSLPPMPRGSYAEVIKGPARRLVNAGRALDIDDALVDALLADVEAGGAKDALPLLAFTLERLYDEYHAGGTLKLEHYETLGRVKGSIEAAVEGALSAANADPGVPKDQKTRLALLRRGLIPWLAGIDPETGAPRRRVARLSEIPPETWPLINQLVEQRLLATDIAADTGETTIEPSHEALLRQWSLLQGWLTEDAALLSALDSVKRAAKEWDQGGRTASWLVHNMGRLEAAEMLSARPDLAGLLEPRDLEYLAACRGAERAADEAARAAAHNRQRMRAIVASLLVGIIAGLLGWINQGFLREEWNWYAVMRPYMNAEVRPYVLSDAAEQALQPMNAFRECARDCPEMIVLPAGSYIMGSPASERGRGNDEGPQHKVTIAAPFAVAVNLVTFAEWDACVAVGGCPPISDDGFGRGSRPAINVNWHQAQIYVAWLSRMTGKHYRLPSETEWEYAARAGTTSTYYWGDKVGVGDANCIGCGSRWDNRQTSPTGSFKPNAFKLYDMTGNVWEWLEDCYHDSYVGAPIDASAWVQGCEKSRRAVRGGGWDSLAANVRIANRDRISIGTQINDLGFRIARTLSTRESAP